MLNYGGKHVLLTAPRQRHLLLISTSPAAGCSWFMARIIPKLRQRTVLKFSALSPQSIPRLGLPTAFRLRETVSHPISPRGQTLSVICRCYATVRRFTLKNSLAHERQSGVSRTKLLTNVSPDGGSSGHCVTSKQNLSRRRDELMMRTRSFA